MSCYCIGVSLICINVNDYDYEYVCIFAIYNGIASVHSYY